MACAGVVFDPFRPLLPQIFRKMNIQGFLRSSISPMCLPRLQLMIIFFIGSSDSFDYSILSINKE